MNSMYVAFSAVFPILLYISIGYFLKTVKLLEENSLSKINILVFKLFLPCLLFYNIYTTKLSEVFNLKLLLFSICSVLAVYILLLVLVPVFIKDNKVRGAFVQGSFRSNFVLFGIPLSASILGDGNVGITSLLIAFIVPLYNVISVVCLEIFRKNKIDFKGIFLGIIKNPLIISSVLGFIFLLLNIKLPNLILSPLKSLSNVATPLSLIVLGGTFSFVSAGKNIYKLSAVLVIKLVLIPLIALFVGGYLFEFRGAAFVSLISMFATPTAVSSFSMAKAMNSDSEFASEIVVSTSAFSIITVFLFIMVTKSLGFF